MRLSFQYRRLLLVYIYISIQKGTLSSEVYFLPSVLFCSIHQSSLTSEKSSLCISIRKHEKAVHCHIKMIANSRMIVAFKCFDSHYN